MYLTIVGTAISDELVKIQPDYKVDTKLALNWIQQSDGNWTAADRGATADTYDTEVTIAGKQSVVDAFVGYINTGRLVPAYPVTLCGFLDSEHIFGEDVSYTSGIQAEVLSIDKVEQRSWQLYAVRCKMRAVSPSFTGSATLPTLRNIQTNIKKSVDYTLYKKDTYYGSFSYADMVKDTGVLEISVQMPIADVVKMRRYIATQRSGTFTIADLYGISNPWGPTRTSTYPITAKMLEWSDEGWFGLTHRQMNFKLAEVI